MTDTLAAALQACETRLPQPEPLRFAFACVEDDGVVRCTPMGD